MPNPLFAALGREPRTQKGPKKKEASASHKRARLQEKEVSVRLGGRPTPGSGAFDVKGDVRVKSVARVECKTTKHKSFSVTLDMARKIEEAALAGGEMPVLLIEFNDGEGRKLSELAVIPSYFLDDLCTRAE